MAEIIKKYWNEFYNSLFNSIRDIDQCYFVVDYYDEDSVNGYETDLRERVYCYELYHQLRHHLPIGFPYTLHSEVDKRNHDIIKKDFDKWFKNNQQYMDIIKAPNPDFIIHHPGEMDEYSNLAVIEVKHTDNINTSANFKKDLLKLEIFINEIDYKFGIFLFYGPDHTQKNQNKVIRALTQGQKELIKDHRLKILYHKNVGEDPVDIWHQWLHSSA